MSDIIQEDIFYYCEEKNFRGIESKVCLSQLSLTITETGSEKKKRTINVDDVIGSLCMRNQDPNEGQRNHEQDTVSVFLCIYFYSLSKNFKKQFWVLVVNDTAKFLHVRISPWNWNYTVPLRMYRDFSIWNLNKCQDGLESWKNGSQNRVTLSL